MRLTSHELANLLAVDRDRLYEPLGDLLDARKIDTDPDDLTFFLRAPSATVKLTYQPRP